MSADTCHTSTGLPASSDNHGAAGPAAQREFRCACEVDRNSIGWRASLFGCDARSARSPRNGRAAKTTCGIATTRLRAGDEDSDALNGFDEVTLLLPNPRPLVALTIGDVAGIGPEVIARAWQDPELLALARPFVIGNADVMRRAVSLVGGAARVDSINTTEFAEPDTPCHSLCRCFRRRVAGCASRSHRCVTRAKPLTRRSSWRSTSRCRRIDAITTLPLNKESLRRPVFCTLATPRDSARSDAAPRSHAMMLYLAPPFGGGAGLGVLHATLHVALRDVFKLLTVNRVRETIELADRIAPVDAGKTATHRSGGIKSPRGGTRAVRRRGDSHHPAGCGASTTSRN